MAGSWIRSRLYIQRRGIAIWPVPGLNLWMKNFPEPLKLLSKRENVWNWGTKSFQIASNSIQFGLKKKKKGSSDTV